MHDDVLHLLLLRGDHDLNEVKTQKLIGAFRFATDREIETALKCKAGYIGRSERERQADRRPRGRCAERFRVRGRRGRLPPARREFRPRSSRTFSGS